MEEPIWGLILIFNREMTDKGFTSYPCWIYQFSFCFVAKLLQVLKIYAILLSKMLNYRKNIILKIDIGKEWIFRWEFFWCTCVEKRKLEGYYSNRRMKFQLLIMMFAVKLLSFFFCLINRNVAITRSVDCTEIKVDRIRDEGWTPLIFFMKFLVISDSRLSFYASLRRDDSMYNQSHFFLEKFS